MLRFEHVGVRAPQSSRDAREDAKLKAEEDSARAAAELKKLRRALGVGRRSGWLPLAKS